MNTSLADNTRAMLAACEASRILGNSEACRDIMKYLRDLPYTPERFELILWISQYAQL